jgi:hypothetical protein
MNRLVLKEQVHLVMKLVGLWAALLVLPFTERTLLHARTYYGLFVGLALVFVVYGFCVRSVFFFLPRARPQPFYVWIGFAAWSVILCSVLAVFAFQYDLLPCPPDPSQNRPLIDYLYYEVITFTTVGYGDIAPQTIEGKILAMCTALLGATHGVTFVALVLLALNPQAIGKVEGGR